jgi:RimJ/RimL family protein N-acetyltransferase
LYTESFYIIILFFLLKIIAVKKAYSLIYNKKIFYKDIYLQSLNLRNINKNYYNWLNNKFINKYLECRFLKHSKASSLNYIKKINRSKNNLLFGIFYKDNHIGNIKISINKIHKRGTIGLLIGDRNFMRRGYGSSAVICLSNFAFRYLGLTRIFIGLYKKNLTSLYCFQKAGYLLEAEIKNYWISNNKSDNHIIMSLNKNFFLKNKYPDFYIQ